MPEVAFLAMPDECLLLPEILEAEFTDVQFVQVVELLWVGRIVPSEDLVLAQVHRLQGKQSRLLVRSQQLFRQSFDGTLDLKRAGPVVLYHARPAIAL